MTAPIRTCIGCGAKRDKAVLIRLAAEGGIVRLDEEGHHPGRGAYVCSAGCARKAVARKALARAFRQKVEPAAELLETLQASRP